jgi:hypothetical protein
MTAHTSDIDSQVVGDHRRGVGVRHSAASLLEYDLTVIARTAEDTVRAAGGWLCDRVRAGWKVSVLLTDSDDVLPLHVLGVRTVPAGTDPIALVQSNPAALAIPADLLDSDKSVRASVVRAAERGAMELTVWGCAPAQQGALAGRMAPTRHQMSGAARAFKSQALVAAGSPCATVDLAEQFYSCALWYPAEGPDLSPVG